MNLGQLELLILKTLRLSGSLTPAQLHRKLAYEGLWQTSYTTMAATMRRLEQKGLLVALPLKGRQVEYSVDTQRKTYQRAAREMASQVVEVFGVQNCPARCDEECCCPQSIS